MLRPDFLQTLRQSNTHHDELVESSVQPRSPRPRILARQIPLTDFLSEHRSEHLRRELAVLSLTGGQFFLEERDDVEE